MEPHWPTGSPKPVEVPPGEQSGGAALSRDGAIRLLPLSAKSPEALRDLAGLYLSWLDEHAEELRAGTAAAPLLADMAWTACVGRSHFDYRAGLVFRDAAELREGLEAVAETGEPPARRPADGEENPVEAVAAAYEAGTQVSFAGLFAGEERRRIAIPGYPFQRRRFWVQGRGPSDAQG